MLVTSPGPSSVLGQVPRRLYLGWVDRALFIWLYRRSPRILEAITIVRPDTVVGIECILPLTGDGSPVLLVVDRGLPKKVRDLIPKNE